MMGNIEVEKESDNESSGSESERSSKFDYGTPLLFSGDSIDMDSLPDNIKSRMETITVRRQMVGKLGKCIGEWCPVYSTLEEFEDCGFTLKRVKCFPSTLCLRNLKTQQSPLSLDLSLSKTRSGKSRDYMTSSFSRKLHFQNVFRPHENGNPAFSPV